jgi:hypothetical protein
MNTRRASGPQYKYQVCVQPAPHLANFHHLRALGLRHRQCPEHALDRFTIGAHHRLDRFARSTPLPPALEHTVDLDRFADAPDHALRRCPDRALRLTPSFPSLQVIHEELAKCCRILSSSSKIELTGQSDS